LGLWRIPEVHSASPRLEPVYVNNGDDGALLAHDNQKRMQMLHDQLLDTPDEALIVVDAWDTVIMASPEEVVEKYRALGSAVVICAEYNLWPDRPPGGGDGGYPEADGHFKYINSGGFIGTAASLPTMFAKMRAHFGEQFHCDTYFGSPRDAADDMRCWHWYFVNQGRAEIRRDTNATIWLNLNDVAVQDVSADEDRPGRVVFKGSSLPSMLHAQGNGKEALRRHITRDVAAACRVQHPKYAQKEERYA
jgi:hypothetical protein